MKKIKSQPWEAIVLEESKSLFNHIRDLEFQYFVTFFKNPTLFNKYYVKKSIFSEEVVGEMMVIIEDLYQSDKAITQSNLYQSLQEKSIDIEYNTLKSIIKIYEQLPLDTIVSTIQTIKANTAKMNLFIIMQNGAHKSKLPDLDVGTFVSETIDKLDEVSKVTSIGGEDFDDILDKIIMQTEAVSQGKITTYYKTGVKEIDKKFPIVDDNIILVGGPAKAGKSRLVMWLLNKLYERNIDVFASNWFSFEENADEVARKFIASDTLLPDEVITGRERKITADETMMIIESAKRFKRLNIKIQDAPKSIQQVAAEFYIFCKKNSSKVPILIIDNALLLVNDEFNRDDIIMNTLNHIKQRTKAIIFIVHHFNDDQQKEERTKDAFRPTLKDLKGREAFRRVPKVVLLINYPYKYPAIKNKYKLQEDILKYMFILDVAAIRYMGEKEVEGSSTENNLIHMYTDLGVNRFYPLSSLWEGNEELND